MKASVSEHHQTINPHEPVSRLFGSDRGTPIDRYYIESFLQRHVVDIRGRALEVGDASYTRRFGGTQVVRSDVLHAVEGNRNATIVGNLETGQNIPQSAYDCMILTQVLPFLFDLRGAVQTIHRCLRPSGVALATVPGISQISRYDMDRWGDFWRLTSLSAHRLFTEAFVGGSVEVQTHGNVSAATSFLQGRALHEVDPIDLDYVDPDYQVIITVRAVKGFSV